MTRRFKQLASAGAVAALMGAAGSAQAVAANSTFYFNANCADCAVAANAAGYGVMGTLVLQNYSQGSAITAENFVSFTYSGSNLVAPYSVTPSGSDGDGTTNDFTFSFDFSSVSGSIPATLPAAAEFDLIFDDGLRFNASADGNWYTCAPAPGWASGNGAYYGGSDCFNHSNNDNGTGQFARAPGTGPLGPNGPGRDLPEPGVYSLALLGLGAAFIARRRQRQP